MSDGVWFLLWILSTVAWMLLLYANYLRGKTIAKLRRQLDTPHCINCGVTGEMLRFVRSRDDPNSYGVVCRRCIDAIPLQNDGRL